MKYITVQSGDTISRICKDVAVYDNEINAEFRRQNPDLFNLNPGTVLIVPDGDPRDRSEVLDSLPHDGIVAEIGTFYSGFAKEILVRNHPRKLFLIDPWCEQPWEIYPEPWIQKFNQNEFNKMYHHCLNIFKQEILEGRVIPIRSFSHLVATWFDDDFFDWVFIDGNHGYNAVLQDLKDYYPKVKHGGYIFGKSYRNWLHCGVKKAVDEFIQTHPVTMQAISFVGYGWFLIKKV